MLKHRLVGMSSGFLIKSVRGESDNLPQKVAVIVMLLLQAPYSEYHVSGYLRFIWAEGEKTLPLDEAVSQPRLWGVSKCCLTEHL